MESTSKPWFHDDFVTFGVAAISSGPGLAALQTATLAIAAALNDVELFSTALRHGVGDDPGKRSEAVRTHHVKYDWIEGRCIKGNVGH